MDAGAKAARSKGVPGLRWKRVEVLKGRPDGLAGFALPDRKSCSGIPPDLFGEQDLARQPQAISSEEAQEAKEGGWVQRDSVSAQPNC